MAERPCYWGVLCVHLKSCAVVGSCYASGRPCIEHQLMLWNRCLWRGWVTFRKYFTGKGWWLPTTVGVRKLQWLPFHVVSKYV